MLVASSCEIRVGDGTLFINGETYGLNVDWPPVIAYNTTTHLAHKGLERAREPNKFTRMGRYGPYGT